MGDPQGNVKDFTLERLVFAPNKGPVPDVHFLIAALNCRSYQIEPVATSSLRGSCLKRMETNE